MHRFIEGVFSQIWPMIVVCSIMMIVLRIAYLCKTKQKVVIHHEIFMFIFVIYMMCLFYVVTFQDIDGKGISTFNIIPFKEMFRYPIGNSLFFKNVVLRERYKEFLNDSNSLMFVPFGFFTAYLLRKTRLHWVLLITLIVSLSIELLQTQIGRVFDIDDVLLNLIGGAIGYGVFAIGYHFSSK